MSSSSHGSTILTAAKSALASPHPALGRAWPFVPRDSNDALLHNYDARQPGLPHAGSVFNVTVHKSDLSGFEEWTEFTVKKRTFERDLASGSEKARRAVADAYHALGVALMSHSERINHYSEARQAFSQDYLISSKYLQKSDTIFALRKLSDCYAGEGNYTAAIRHAEQALTVALTCKPVQQEEAQALYVRLGAITNEWLDNVIDAGGAADEGVDSHSSLQGNVWEQRVYLTKQLLHYYTRAYKRSETIETSMTAEADSNGRVTPQKKKEMQRNALTNLAISLQQKVVLLTIEDQEQRRFIELQTELKQDITCYTSVKNINAHDVSGMFSSRVFPLSPTPPAEGRELIQEATRHLYAAENLTFFKSSSSSSSKVMRVLDVGVDEIDSIEDSSQALQCDIDAHSRIRHALGSLYESGGQLEKALEQYIFAVRRMNVLRNEAKKDAETYALVFESQWKSLKNAALVCVKLEKWIHGRSLLQQMQRLLTTAQARITPPCSEEEFTDLQTELDGTKALLEQAKTLQTALQPVERAILTLNNKAQVNTSTELEKRYQLYYTKYWLLDRDLKKYTEVDGLLSTRSEYYACDLQVKMNCQRELWNIGRQQREMMMNEAGVDAKEIEKTQLPPTVQQSIRRECLLLIGLCQSVSAMCEIHLPRAPSSASASAISSSTAAAASSFSSSADQPTLERRLCTYYWTICKNWFELVLNKLKVSMCVPNAAVSSATPTPTSSPSTIPLLAEHYFHLCMTLREQADALETLLSPASEVRQLRIAAYEAAEMILKSGTGGKDVYEKCTSVRLELVESVVAVYDAARPSLSSSSAAAASSTSTTFAAERARWSLLLRELQSVSAAHSKQPSLARWSVDHLQEVYEQERRWDFSVVPQRVPAMLQTATTAAVTLKKPATSTTAAAASSSSTIKTTSSSIAPVKIAATATKPSATISSPVGTKRVQLPAAASSKISTDKSVTLAPTLASSQSQKISVAASSTVSSTVTSSSSPRKRKRITDDGSGSQQTDDQDADGDAKMSDEMEKILQQAAASHSESSNSRKKQHVNDENHPNFVNPPVVTPQRAINLPQLTGTTYIKPTAQIAATQMKPTTIATANQSIFAQPPPSMIPSLPPASTVTTVASAFVQPMTIVPTATPTAAQLSTLPIAPQPQLTKVASLTSPSSNSNNTHIIDSQSGTSLDSSLSALKLLPLSSLHILRFSTCSFDTKQAVALTAWINDSSAALTNLHTLDMSNCISTKVGWTHLIAVLPKLKTLHTLILNRTIIGVWAYIYLLKALTKCATLRKLHLEECHSLLEYTESDRVQYTNGLEQLKKKPSASMTLPPSEIIPSVHIIQLLTSQPSLQEISLRGAALPSEVLAQLVIAFAGRSSAATAGSNSTPSIATSTSDPFTLPSLSRLNLSNIPVMSKEAQVLAAGVEKLQAVYTAVEMLATAVKGRVTLALNLSGWANLNGLLCTSLCRLLRSPACVILELELLDTDFTPTEVQILAAAIIDSRTFRTLAIRPRMDAPCTMEQMTAALAGLKEVPEICVKFE